MKKFLYLIIIISSLVVADNYSDTEFNKKMDNYLSDFYPELVEVRKAFNKEMEQRKKEKEKNIKNSQNDIVKAKRYHQEAKKLMNANLYNQALELLKKSEFFYKKVYFKINENEAYFARLCSEKKKKKYDEECYELDSISTADPNLSSVYHDIGFSYNKLYQYKKAYAYYKKSFIANYFHLTTPFYYGYAEGVFFDEMSFIAYKLKDYTNAYSKQHLASEAFLRFKNKSFSHMNYNEQRAFFNDSRYNLHNLLTMAYTYHSLPKKFKNNSKGYNNLQNVPFKVFELWLNVKGEVSQSESDLMLLRKRSNKQSQTKFQIDKLIEKKQIYSKLFIKTLTPRETPLSQEEKRKLEKVKNEIDNLEKYLKPKIEAIRYPVKIDNVYINILEELSEKLFDDELYIDFARVDATHYYAFTFNKQKQVSFYRLSQMENIDKLIKKFREQIKNKGDVKSIGNRLYRAIFGNIKELSKYKNIIVSPDGLLNLLPLEALYTNNQNYLIQEKNIYYILSGKDLIEKRGRRRYSKKSREVVVLTYLDYDHDTDTTISNSISNFQLKNQRALNDLISDVALEKLEATKNEGNNISNILGKDRVSVKTNKQGTKEFLYSLNSPMILHLSTHSIFAKDNKNTINPLLKAGLVLSEYNAIYNQGDNRGLMTAMEFSNLNLYDTELVFFASCQSRIGDIITSEGVSGLNRGARIAGAKRVISSLWSVDDDASVHLTTNFYKHLKKTNINPLATDREVYDYHYALKLSKLDMIKQHPYYWAGFVYYGVDIRYDKKAFEEYYNTINSMQQSISDSIIKSINSEEVNQSINEIIDILLDEL